MEESTKQLKENVKNIADSLTNCNKWREEYAKDNDVDVEEVGAAEWLEDALDIRYITSRDKEYISAQVLVAFGGPNIWVNFDDKEVVGYWGGDKERAPFNDNLGVDDYLEETF